MSAAERLRAPSAGNVREPGSAPYQPPQLQGHLRRDNRELDKAKSIPNLRMDNSFDGRPETMRPAQSVSALQQQQRMPSNPDYYNQPHSLDESRTPDYENQPVDPRLRQDMRSYPNASQSPGPQYSKPHQAQRPAASRSMQNFERPQSAYYGQQQDRPDFVGGRPKSDEISPEKLQNWQDMDRSRGSSHDQSFENQAPNYSNIRPQPNYANQGEIRKMDVGNQPRQPNFYENTVPRQQEPTPPFQQLRRPPSESDKNRPPVTPKPAPKPNQPIVQPAEIPRSDVDNRQTQPHFYSARPQDRPGYPGTSQTSYSPSPQQSHYQNTNFHHGPSPGLNDYRHKISPSRDNFGKKGLDMPPPPGDIPPELPPPPSMDEIQDEDLPPLPPPPVTDYRLEQKIREEQDRLLQQQQPPGDPSYSNLPPSRNAQFGSPVVQNGPRSPHDRNSFPGQHSLPPQSAGYQPPQSAGYQSQPHSLPPHSAGYSPNHDYQNIAYPTKTETMQVAPGPHVQQNLYESYDSRRQQQNSRPQILEGDIKGQREAIISPWEREAKEKQQKQINEDLNRMREMEIGDLESRPHLTPQEEERLRKLRLDQEFQRRLQEVSGKDEDEDSDDDRMVSEHYDVFAYELKLKVQENVNLNVGKNRFTLVDILI